MTFKKVVYQLHLWIGLVSGIIVFIVCITGAIWGLNIYGWIDTDKLDEDKIAPSSTPILPPSQLAESAKEILGITPTYITYSKDAPVTLGTYGKGNRVSILLNPYTGKAIEGQKTIQGKQKQKGGFNFWNFIRQGHRALWLPWNVGRPIVNYGTLAFALTLLTGIIIWLPKSRKQLKNRLSFRWKKGTPIKRELFDLHSIGGIYVCLILLIIAFTGMVWGISWWSESIYKITTGGKSLPEWRSSVSDTLRIDTLMTPNMAVDRVYAKLSVENPNAESISIYYPDEADKASVISATVSPEKDMYYNSDRYTFDRYSLEEIKSEGPYAGKYSDASFGDKLRRMNYEIHTGLIGGLAGELLVFFGALFGASLPVTGVYIYAKLHLKKRRKTLKK